MYNESVFKFRLDWLRLTVMLFALRIAFVKCVISRGRAYGSVTAVQRGLEALG